MKEQCMENKLIKHLNKNELILPVSGFLETIRRYNDSLLDPYLADGKLLFSKKGRKLSFKIYEKFLDLAKIFGVPMILTAPTWRTNKERTLLAGCKENIIYEVVNIFTDWIAEKSYDIILAGSIGPKGDCYIPKEAPSILDAMNFHIWQIEKLCNTEIDVIICETMPSVNETIGIAKAMQNFDKPFVISFVINSSGRVLDGSSLEEAFSRVDEISTNVKPVGFAIYCAYPSFINFNDTSNYVRDRLISYRANASSKDQLDLDGSTQLIYDPIEDWLDGMVRIYRETNARILGGCCGTDATYLNKLFTRLVQLEEVRENTDSNKLK